MLPAATKLFHFQGSKQGAVLGKRLFSPRELLRPRRVAVNQLTHEDLVLMVQHADPLEYALEILVRQASRLMRDRVGAERDEIWEGQGLVVAG